MFFRICKIALLFLIFSTPVLSQTQDDVEKQRAEYEKKALEELEKRVQTFVFDLKADDFQKEIIKQKLYSYFEKKKELYLNQDLKYFERDEQLLVLNNSHFTDLKQMVSEETMEQINTFIKDAGTTLAKQKKKEKKKKKKN
ncbi:hypothetical protein M0G43_07900 [Subsaxibacter sp. CAU 1640]|uniref:hypothetical protein n=1 Tax=Subsaxibacter sp. CAU 1640 TaxID=2933271 RepID=UPI0020046092|nr:hypothetical protein [Subsaxibacter sp. CAU 1640]MCK7590490.1 hypothetical protein [Subsaxibacter sp. CAU 1640]